jgi:chromate transporter
MNLFELFLVFVKASVLSFGGSALPAILHNELGHERHVLREDDFVAAIAIGQLAPGPNGLMSLAVGYFVAGLPGALMAALALFVVSWPVLLLLRIQGWMERVPTVKRGVRGVQAGAIGLTFALGYIIAHTIPTTPLHFVVAAGAFVLIAFTRVDVVLVLGGAALIGLVAFLGWSA